MKLYGTFESQEPCCNVFNASHNPHFLSLWKTEVLSVPWALMQHSLTQQVTPADLTVLPPVTTLMQVCAPKPSALLGPVRVSVAIREPFNKRPSPLALGQM